MAAATVVASAGATLRRTLGMNNLAMRRTMSTMTNQTARRGGFFNRVYQVATVTVAGAGTDAVRAVCSAPATAFRQGMPLVVDWRLLGRAGRRRCARTSACCATPSLPPA